MRDRFILGGSPDLIQALSEVIAKDPELELIAVSGPADAPERIVAAMSPERADLFDRALGGQLRIERDEELQQFGQ